MNSLKLLMILCATLAIVSCTKSVKEKEKKFQVTSPIVIDTKYQNEYVAEICALQNVEIRSQIKGCIETIKVDEGQTVHKGQILFTINGKVFQQELQKMKATKKSAIADLKSAEIELESTQKLFDKNIVAKSELDMVKAKVDAMNAKVAEAEADEAQAELNLSFAEIQAPFDGIINRIPNKKGSLVQEGTLLTTISNNKEVYAYFNVSETDYLNYAVSKKAGKANEVSLVLANNSLYDYKGIIETCESEFDKSTGTIAFRAKFPNPQQILKHGSSGKILVDNELKNALIIPQESTFEVQGDTFVYVINKDNEVQRRKIIPANRLKQLYVVGSGLTAQDKFIYNGIQQVREGEKIIPETVSFSQLINH